MTTPNRRKTVQSAKPEANRRSAVKPSRKDVRQVHVEVALSVTVGVLLCEFHEFHGFVEHVMGHLVYAHELREAIGPARELVLAQHPALRDAAPFEPPEPLGDRMREYITRYVAGEVARIGRTAIPVTKGHAVRTESPIDSAARLMPGARIDAVLAGRGRP